MVAGLFVPLLFSFAALCFTIAYNEMPDGRVPFREAWPSLALVAIYIIGGVGAVTLAVLKMGGVR